MTERLIPQWWVVTDLDGTLLDHTYDWTPAETTLRWLQQRGIPVIPCTSKTAEELYEQHLYHSDYGYIVFYFLQGCASFFRNLVYKTSVYLCSLYVTPLSPKLDICRQFADTTCRRHTGGVYLQPPPNP